MPTRYQPHQLKALSQGQPLPPPLPRKKRSQEESRAQRSVIRWWHQFHKTFGIPRCALHSVPNGGFRSVVTASIMKAEGQVRGVFDLKLNVARGRKHGLWLEMKAAKGVLSADQIEFGDAMRGQGYQVCVAHSARQAVDILTTYITAP